MDTLKFRYIPPPYALTPDKRDFGNVADSGLDFNLNMLPAVLAVTHFSSRLSRP